MNFKKYQELANGTNRIPRCDLFVSDKGATNDIGVLYCALGLAGETGEVIEKIKKTYRDDLMYFSPEKKEEIAKELGDIMWYLAGICTELGLSLDDVAEGNIKKLQQRLKDGKIHGSGDNR